MPRICVIQINVTDMDQAIDFYSNKLGFEIASRDHYPNIVKLASEPVPIILYRIEPGTQSDYPNAVQTLVNLETDNLEKSLTDLKQKGARLMQASPQTCPVGIYAGVQDPSGNVIELVEYSAKKTQTNQ